MIIGKRTI